MPNRSNAETTGKNGLAQMERREPNNTGMPDQLKTGIETLSGIAMDDVKVHYNSSRPSQLSAFAFAQANEIHIGPGQERHLPHEAWHVVQQKQDRVQPTGQLAAGVQINDDKSLEQEASVKGAEALHVIQRREVLEERRVNMPASGAMAPIQGFFDVERLLKDPARRERLFAAGIDIDDLEDVQELLKDKASVNKYLKELELAMEAWFRKKEVSQYKYTRALDMALFEQEKKWAVTTPESQAQERSQGSVNKIPAIAGQQPTLEFLAGIRSGKPIKDVGAAVSHGEYAHRIQWYVISRSAMDIGSVTPAWLRDFYKALGEEEFITEVKDITATALQNTWNLWNALVDVPGSVVDDNPQPGKIGEVGIAAPVKLTGALSAGTEDVTGGGLQYSQLRLAVLNRRLKRYFEEAPKRPSDPAEREKKSEEGPGRDKTTASALTPEEETFGRGDKDLAGMLINIEATMGDAKCPPSQIGRVLEILKKGGNYTSPTKHGAVDFSYDDLNAIALGLCGIPLKE
jgi:hypothetical protein